MNSELIALLTSYLEGQTDIDCLRDWIALNVWDSPEEARDLIDQVAVELAYIDDGNSDEDYFRIRMADFVTPTRALPS